MVGLVVSCTNARLESIIAQHIDTIENNSRYDWIRLTTATEIQSIIWFDVLSWTYGFT